MKKSEEFQISRRGEKKERMFCVVKVRIFFRPYGYLNVILLDDRLILYDFEILKLLSRADWQWLTSFYGQAFYLHVAL